MHVPSDVQQSAGAQAAARVHGIADDEIERGALFPDAWARFLAFADACLNNAIDAESDESGDEIAVTRPPDVIPSLLLVGHNGCRFDFALLLFECQRHQLSTSSFRRWLFVDTLHVFESAKAEVGVACLKLQCLVNTTARACDLRAHRALDDCIALRHVVHSVANRLDCSVTCLLSKFALQWDEPSSMAQVAALLAD